MTHLICIRTLILKFKLLSIVILTALSATAFSATEQTFADNSEIKLNKKSIGSDLRIYKGKPVLAIANPDKNKVSHNYFDEFNVGKEGLYIGNTKKANTIIAEVVSYSPSLLNGNIEILRNPAKLIIANPNGIVCSGCSTRNVTSFALNAGKSVKTDYDSHISSNYHVKNGNVQFINTKGELGSEKLSVLAKNISIVNSRVHSPDINIQIPEHDMQSPAIVLIDKKSSLSGNNAEFFIRGGYFENNGALRSMITKLVLHSSQGVNNKNGAISGFKFNPTVIDSEFRNEGNINLFVFKLYADGDDTQKLYNPDTGNFDYQSDYSFINNGNISGQVFNVESFYRNIQLNKGVMANSFYKLDLVGAENTGRYN